MLVATAYRIEDQQSSTGASQSIFPTHTMPTDLLCAESNYPLHNRQLAQEIPSRRRFGVRSVLPAAFAQLRRLVRLPRARKKHPRRYLSAKHLESAAKSIRTVTVSNRQSRLLKTGGGAAGLGGWRCGRPESVPAPTLAACQRWA